MTSDRAVKLAQKVAQAVLVNGPYSDTVLAARITNQVADLLLRIDWRVLPEDEVQRKDQELFTGQMGLGL
jgi:hypothetical protein